MPEVLQVLTVDQITEVYGAGFVLTLAAWVLGAKIGIVISAIRKL